MEVFAPLDRRTVAAAVLVGEPLSIVATGVDSESDSSDEEGLRFDEEAVVASCVAERMGGKETTSETRHSCENRPNGAERTFLGRFLGLTTLSFSFFALLRPRLDLTAEVFSFFALF